jgi:hypothetical protein
MPNGLCQSDRSGVPPLSQGKASGTMSLPHPKPLLIIRAIRITPPAAGAAHIYGKRDCPTEAFPSGAGDWIDAPWSMKDGGDAAFCKGLTRFRWLIIAVGLLLGVVPEQTAVHNDRRAGDVVGIG